MILLEAYSKPCFISAWGQNCCHKIESRTQVIKNLEGKEWLHYANMRYIWTILFKKNKFIRVQVSNLNLLGGCKCKIYNKFRIYTHSVNSTCWGRKCRGKKILLKIDQSKNFRNQHLLSQFKFLRYGGTGFLNLIRKGESNGKRISFCSYY